MGVPAQYDKGFFGHPRGLSTLFFTELWERFSFYGMKAFLLLYLTGAVADGGLGFGVAKGTAIFALYTSTGYLLGLPGGWIADRFIGQRRAVLFGGILIMLGHFSLAVQNKSFFFTGLCLIVAGTGLLKPNISAIVGGLYRENDERRDSGFSLFYMGINFGALGGPLICGYLGESVNWHLGFSVAGLGMLFGLVQYVRGTRYLGEAGLKPVKFHDPVEAARHRRILVAGVLAAFLAATMLIVLQSTGVLFLTAEKLADSFGAVLFAIPILFFAWLFLAERWTPAEKGRLAAIVVLFMSAAFFWAAYEQAGSSLTLFARDSVDRTLAWMEDPFPVSWFQNFPALFCVILAPVFAWLWVWLGKRQPSSPAKFSIGLVLVGIGFIVMMGAASASAGGAMISPWWLIGTYFLHVLGEMCLSPVGLSTMTKLAPARVSGMMMGVWFLAASVGNYVGGRAAGFYEFLPPWKLFALFVLLTFGAAALLALLARPIRRMMGGVR
jgi:POT family proton-dependent oligopeptide transporter